VDFAPEINFSPRPVEMLGAAGKPDFERFFSSNASKSRSQCGFHESAFCKILPAKNLDLKILKTNDLARQVLASIDRHCLDNHCAIAGWAQGQMSQCTCGKNGAAGVSDSL
jgi:hypothetical protein